MTELAREFIGDDVRQINNQIYAYLQFTKGTSTSTAPSNYFGQTHSYDDWSNINGTGYVTITADAARIEVRLTAPNGCAATIPSENQIWLQAIRIA